jgi:hypothetical protein
MSSREWWREENFSEALLSFLCRDRDFLKKFGSILRSEDFRPASGETKEKHIVAKIALRFWKKHRVPIGGMLRTEVLSRCEADSVPRKIKEKAVELVNAIISGDKLASPEAIEEKVQQYIYEKIQEEAIEEIITLREKKKLTTDAFAAVCRRVVDGDARHRLIGDNIFSEKGLESRIVRRKLDINRKRPLLMIDGIDEKTAAIGKGDVGIWLGPLKKGKSMALIYTCTAYARQNVKSIFISLEDPKEEVEDRFDASVAMIPTNKLVRYPKRLRRRWKRHSKHIRDKVRFVDAVGEKVTLADIEELWERLRDDGFEAEAVFIDYDKYIEPEIKMRDKLEEWDALYKGLRRFGGKRGLYIWVAAQTKRISDAVQIISADKIGEDIGKAQKATMMLGIGQGPTHPDARFIYVTAHKRGRSRFGCEVMTEMDKGLFYSREKTYEMMKKKFRKENEK